MNDHDFDPYEKPKRKRKPSQLKLWVAGMLGAALLLSGLVFFVTQQPTSDSNLDNQAVVEFNTSPIDPQGELVAYEGGWWLAQWAGPYTMVRQYALNADGTASMTRNDQTTESIAVFDMTINRDGVSLVATANGLVRMIHPAGETDIRAENSLSHVTFSPQGTEYALMNAANGYYAVYQTYVNSVVYDDRLPVGSNWQLALGYNSRVVAAYNTRELLTSPSRPGMEFDSEDVIRGLISDVTFTPDGLPVIVTSENVTIYEADGGMRIYPTETGMIHDGEVVVSPDGKWMAVANNRDGGHLVRYRLAADPLAPDSNTPTTTFGNMGSAIVGMAFSPDNQYLGVAYGNGTFYILDVESGMPVAQVN